MAGGCLFGGKLSPLICCTRQGRTASGLPARLPLRDANTVLMTQGARIVPFIAPCKQSVLLREALWGSAGAIQDSPRLYQTHSRTGQPRGADKMQANPRSTHMSAHM